MPRIQLLVVQPTPFCNIDCRYCYLPDRTNKAVVAEATLANLFSQVFASGWVRDGVTIVWHAGEPMVLPIDFYRSAFRLIDGLKPADLAVTHSFQTNGTLIDDAWCEFFAAEQISVGVSIDGPQLLHDINRRTRSGRGTFDRAIAGIRTLRRNAVPFHVISVLSAESLAAPGEMFAHLRRRKRSVDDDQWNALGSPLGHDAVDRPNETGRALEAGQRWHDDRNDGRPSGHCHHAVRSRCGKSSIRRPPLHRSIGGTRVC